MTKVTDKAKQAEIKKAEFRDSISDEEVAAILSARSAADDRLGHSVAMIQATEPIYTAVFGLLNRKAEERIGTMGVNVKKGRANLYYSEEFANRLSTPELQDVLRHEALHLIFEHCTSRNFLGTGLPHHVVNIAMDLAINSHLHRLPRGCWKPGIRQEIIKRDALGQPVTDEAGNEVWEDSEFADFTEGLPSGKATEFYIRRMLEFMKKNPQAEEQLQKIQGQSGGQGQQGQGGGQGQPGDQGDEQGGQSGQGNDEGDGQEESEGDGSGNGDQQDKGPHGDNVGNHGGWNEEGEDGSANGTDDSDGFGDRLREALRQAVKKCNSTQWGSTSAELRSTIEELLEVTIPWQQIVRKFINASVPAERTSTMKRLNRRYPWIHAGRRRNYRPKFHIYIDQSGSVGNEMLARFFSELNGLARHQEFHVFYFDTEIQEGAVWRKGSKCPLERKLGGGTCFHAPSKHANESDCDGYFILTDGYAPDPGHSRKRRAWILGEECPVPEFLEGSRDIVITLDEKSAKEERL